MTQKRLDSHSTEFGLWLRNQSEIDSKLGYIATNIDYVWKNYKTGYWMLIEEKRFNSKVRFYQEVIFNTVDLLCRIDNKYKGFFIITFEKTCPDDGNIFLNNKLITKQELIDFLRM